MQARWGAPGALRSSSGRCPLECPLLPSRRGPRTAALRLPASTAWNSEPAWRTAQRPRHRLQAATEAPAAPINESAVPEESSDYGDSCMPSEVTVDNSSHESFTVISIEVQDYPGLFRVISWVLNGLELDVHNATLETGNDGMARNSFWLQDVAGKKLSDAMADQVAERLSDFVMYCTPNDALMHAERFGHGPVSVDNNEDEKYSVITVTATKKQRERNNFLLELASALNGVGVKIGRAVIQSCTDCGTPVADPDFPSDDEHGRLYKIWGTDRHGQKLDFARITALLYTVGLVFDKTAVAQTTAPSYTDVLSTR